MYTKLGALPKIILYPLNDECLRAVCAISGAFPNVIVGAAWWFNDTVSGIKRQLETVSEYAVLGTNLGMLTDSRSFSSYVRFDFYRRILSSFIADKVDHGEYDEKSALAACKRYCIQQRKGGFGTVKMTFRWYGENDCIPLNYIKQIQGMSGVVTAVYDTPVGEVWKEEKLERLKNLANDAGLDMEVIESVPVHEDIKLGKPTRDKYIEAYKQNIINCGKVGVRCICYNFMPVFDWLRTDLYFKHKDGSTVACLRSRKIACARSQKPAFAWLGRKLFIGRTQ